MILIARGKTLKKTPKNAQPQNPQQSLLITVY